MALISMNETTTFRWSFEDDVNNFRRAGMDGIGVWRQKMSDFGDEKGIELLADSGLKVACLLWAGGFTGSDGRSHDDSIEDATEAIQLASDMQAECLILYSGARGGHTQNHARRLVVSALEQLEPLARDYDVTLAIEPMHRGCAADWTFLTSLDDAMQLVEQFESPFIKLVFDTYHLGHDQNILERIRSIVPYVALVQLGDYKSPPNGEQNRCLLGQGNLPLREIVGSFITAGYDRFFDVELLGEEIETTDYSQLLTTARDAAIDLVKFAGKDGVMLRELK